MQRAALFVFRFGRHLIFRPPNNISLVPQHTIPASMKKLPRKLIAIVTLISTAVSSMAGESKSDLSSFQIPPSRATLIAPTVLSHKTDFTPAELTKYRTLAVQSRASVERNVAGASDATKTALIVVGVVVVGLGVVLLVISHGGKGIPVGSGNYAFAL